MTELPLRDIHLPPAPGWWPPAPGWWLLGLVGMALALGLVLLLRRQLKRFKQRRTWRHRWQREVERLDEPRLQLQAAMLLLRRLAVEQDAEAMRLHGEAWWRLLDAHLPERPFQNGMGESLQRLPFAPIVDRQAAEPLLKAMRQVLERGWR